MNHQNEDLIKYEHRMFYWTNFPRIAERHTHTLLKIFDERFRDCDVLTFSAPSVTRLGNLLDFGQLFKACGKKVCLNPERWNIKSRHLRTLVTNFKSNTKTIGIYGILGCCVLWRNQNILRVMKWTRLTLDHRFLQTMRALHIPSLCLNLTHS